MQPCLGIASKTHKLYEVTKNQAFPRQRLAVLVQKTSRTQNIMYGDID